MTSSTVPVIIVDDRKEKSAFSPSSSPNKSMNCDTTQNKQSCSKLGNNNNNDDTTKTNSSTDQSSSISTTSSSANASSINIQPSKSNILTRPASDISIPAASMPNLALQLSMTESGSDPNDENYLGVYCSPRMTRRSVDLDRKHGGPGPHEWSDNLDSSNCLKVLTSSSRVGSALSLNSECTTRSIGLLSNDSDSEEFSQSDKISSSGQGQLRRFMSYPEETQVPETNARPSQSLCNLKSANASNETTCGRDRYLQRQSLDYSEVDVERSPSRILSNNRTDENKEDIIKQRGEHNNSLDQVSLKTDGEINKKDKSTISSRINKQNDICSETDSNISPVKQNKNKSSISTTLIGNNINYKPLSGDSGAKRVIGSVKNANNNNMLCYKCDTNSPSREGRIRQWLQDMDTTHACDVLD